MDHISYFQLKKLSDIHIDKMDINSHLNNPLTLSLIILFLGLTLSLLWVRIKLVQERRQNMLLSFREEQHTGQVASFKEEIERIRTERSSLFAENRELTARVSALQTVLAESAKQTEAQFSLLTSTRDRMEKDFQVLAEKILVEKSTSISNTHQLELKNILQPVREQLGEFKKKVEDVHALETKDHIILVQEIEHLKKLNLQISDDAVHLTSALKGQSKVQGLWGEMILERLLEDSGLKKGHEYETQVALKDSNGHSRLPDVLIRLPQDRVIIIDSKVSLTAFERACRTEQPEEEQKYIQQHLDSLKKHITDLAEKGYHLLDGIHSPDFVLLFIPTEGAFQTAVTHDPDILTSAMQKKIILASPSTLMAILKVIHHMWRQEEQTRNSLAIAKQAGNLYDKFIGFLEAFEEIGARLDQSRDVWETARNRLSKGRGNLISRAEKLKNLGVQSNKTLPQSLSVDQDKKHPGINKQTPATGG